jgi:hypothetical protein
LLFYCAINDEAQKIGISIIGHIPVGLSMNDLYESGQSQISHIESITQNEKMNLDGIHLKVATLILSV